jgi:hypothetical protein
VGDVSYAAALKIAKALPGHSDRAAAGAAGGELAPEERSAFKTVRPRGARRVLTRPESFPTAGCRLHPRRPSLSHPI